jgi:phosphatidylserine/phosphatidylglycerophosphate/cardiolipin synthase-like enzyme
MPDFPTQLQTYFVQPADANPPTEPRPSTFTGCQVTPLVDGAEYFQAVGEAVSALTGATGDFVLLANWWLGLSGGRYERPSGWSLVASTVAPVSGPQVVEDGPLRLDGPGGSLVLQDLLIAKARVGVDVRVMGWVSTTASADTLARVLVPGIAAVNGFTMESVKTLRAEATIGKKAILNVIAHSAGAVHSKLVVVGTARHAIGFTGGIDFEAGRYAHPGHIGDETWHDVAARVEGPAVQAMYDWFKDMWWENISRPVTRFRFEGHDLPSFLPGTPVLPARDMPSEPVGGHHHVQSLRTVPQANYAFYNCLPEAPPVSFAPEGRFEVRLALRKALRAARTYVHIEDQSFWAQETLSWVNEAIRASPSLRVILVTNGAADPNDPEFPASYLCHAVNHGLLEGLTPAQVDQVRLFKRFGDVGDVVKRGKVHVTVVIAEDAMHSRVTLRETADAAVPINAYAGRKMALRGAVDFPVVANPAIGQGEPRVLIVDNSGGVAPTPGEYQFRRPLGVTVHAKVYLVDDAWALIGSANTMRRSLYTDLEHSIAFMDEEENAVRQLRSRLYADHFRHRNPDDFDDIPVALNAWEPTWGVAGTAPARPFELESLPLPIRPDVTVGLVDGLMYNNFYDADSRQNWGGLLP